jgi:UDPglucose--hexose-1-phosphate uridylyltransferase
MTNSYFDIIAEMNYASSVAEFRKDPLSGNWVVVGFRKTKINEVGACPFCPGNEHETPPSIRETKDSFGAWLTRCFPASNPVFKIEESENKRAEGFYDKMGTLGAHEIVVESRSHAKTFSTFEPGELSLVVDMYADRLIDLKRDRRFRYVQIFKNHGEITGSYIFHPHSHVLATPIVPQRMAVEIANSKSHYLQKERCLLCDVISQEIRQNKRIVTLTDHFVVLCPFATRLAFEVWILPRSHCADFELWADERVKRDFVEVYLDTMKRIEKVATSYSIVIHTSPNLAREGFIEEEVRVSDYFHWHVEILPRDAASSRYKLEEEFYTVSIMPEETAELLKTLQL